MIAADIPEISLRVDTDRFGPFLFQVGVDAQGLLLPMQRVEDAHVRFAASPLAQVAKQLEREVIASSIYGTNTIEGGALTEDETLAAMDLDPAQVQQIEQRRVLNIKAAYARAREAAFDPGWSRRDGRRTWTRSAALPGTPASTSSSTTRPAAAT